MLELMQNIQAEIRAGPTWVYIWLNVLSLALILSIPFAFVRKEARWVLLSMLFVFPAMLYLYSQVGYVRLLGIVHVIFWTPLLIYLWQRRKGWRVRETLSGKWILIVFILIAISLVFDFADVARWLLGERGHSYLPSTP